MSPQFSGLTQFLLLLGALSCNATDGDSPAGLTGGPSDSPGDSAGPGGGDPVQPNPGDDGPPGGDAPGSGDSEGDDPPPNGDSEGQLPTDLAAGDEPAGGDDGNAPDDGNTPDDNAPDDGNTPDDNAPDDGNPADDNNPADDTPDPVTPVDPVGFGIDTPGGRGGRVIRVTTLQRTGAGSIVEALSTPGPRIIVFEVGGIIDLNRARLDLREPFATIAGQTAPSPGITFIRGGLRVFTHDVRVQHVRFRMGDAGATVTDGFEPDVTTDSSEAHDVVFDHVSVAWGVDENLSISGPRFDGAEGTSRRVTIKDSIIAEGLMNSVHEKGAHSMGTLIHDYCSDIAVVGNLYAHNNERNPWFKGFATGAIVNNVVYDSGRWAMRLGAVVNEWADSGITPQGPRVTVIGNVMHHGASTPTTAAMVDSNSNGSAYLRDNVVVTRAGGQGQVVSSTVGILDQPPSLPTWIQPLPASAVVDRVVATAGARPTDRDAVDERIIANFLAKTGRIIDSQNEVGGYPTAPATIRVLQVPADVEAWLDGLAAQLEGRNTR